VADPLICGMEVAPMFTVCVSEESQPREVVSVTVTVPVPGVFHKMFTLVALLAPMMVPPVAVHKMVLLVADWRA
jgi:hypothetical protein